MDLHIGYGILVPKIHPRTQRRHLEFREVGAQDDKGVDIFQLTPALQQRVERVRLARQEAARESHREAGRTREVRHPDRRAA